MRTRFPMAVRPFLFGALAGASIALVFAPVPGRETRSLIHRNVKESAAATRQFGERVAHKGREVLHSAATAIEKSVS